MACRCYCDLPRQAQPSSQQHSDSSREGKAGHTRARRSRARREWARGGRIAGGEPGMRSFKFFLPFHVPLRRARSDAPDPGSWARYAKFYSGSSLPIGWGEGSQRPGIPVPFRIIPNIDTKRFPCRIIRGYPDQKGSVRSAIKPAFDNERLPVYAAAAAGLWCLMEERDHPTAEEVFHSRQARDAGNFHGDGL